MKHKIRYGKRQHWYSPGYNDHLTWFGFAVAVVVIILAVAIPLGIGGIL